ncbi:MAG: hypothetical protein ACKOXG_10160 [Arenimonas sp.]
MPVRRLLSASLLLLAGSCLASDGTRYEQGQARDPDTRRLLYTESHWTRFEAGLPVRRTVLYRCPDGTAFARKEISYAPSTLAPAFRFTDVRLGYQEGLRWRDGRPELWTSGRDGERAQTLANRTDLVADAGFDMFIRSRWPQLSAGERQSLRFAVPSRLASYGFNLRRSAAVRYREQPAQTFRLGLDGLAGLVAPEIEVTYGRDSRRLLRFKGPSNILDDGGEKPLKTLIEFPVSDRVVGADDEDRARRTLLKSCQLS